MKKIKIESNDGFLHLKDLPHNCIFNKVVTGCGGTTVALKNSDNYIIAVPTTELIVNKTGRTDAGSSMIDFKDGSSRRIFGLFDRFTPLVERGLTEYITTTNIKKIICTYDKVPRLLDYINPQDYRILIDEYHTLLKAYAYRAKAIDGVMENFRRFKSFCFMSATPILPTFKPSCLDGVEEKEADWGEDLDKMRVILKPTNKPYLMAANIINSYKNDGFITVDGIKSKEAFFFINSVTDIAAILKQTNLSNNEVRIICANTLENQEKLIGYTISNSRSPNKMFNFITSKSFEGADYYSETGLCFVVSSSTNKNTLASIDTDIPQIAGRIRTKENPFRNRLVHIFNSTKHRLNLNVTFEDMKAKTTANIEAATKIVKQFNDEQNKGVKDFLRDRLKHDINKLYMSYNKEDDKFVVNDTLPKLELYNYLTTQEVYKNGASVAKYYRSNDVETKKEEYERLDDTLSTKKIRFKDAFLQYAKIASKHPHAPALLFLEQQQPLIKAAYERLGVERVRNLRYVKKSIEAALLCLNTDKTKEQKLSLMMVRLVPTGSAITVAHANELMEQAYSELGISRKPKSKDLHKWFECSDPISRRIDGKVQKVVDIYRSKIIFNTIST